jgi:sporulation protein YlmC with PRC-barrel domain
MLKRHLALGLLGSALIAAPALAQTTPAPVPANPAPPPASTQAAPMTTGQGGSMNFLEVRPQDQFRASKLIGTRVTGANNESIGEINDVLMDQNGRAHAVIIGVGGFLGIGEKDVAIPMTALQFSAGNMDMAQRGATTDGGCHCTSRSCHHLGPCACKQQPKPVCQCSSSGHNASDHQHGDG